MSSSGSPPAGATALRRNTLYNNAANAATPCRMQRIRQGSRFVKEPRSLCARRRKESPIIFFGDMCGEENTSRPANVRAVRLRRTARALRSGRKLLCQKVILFDSFKRPAGCSASGRAFLRSYRFARAAGQICPDRAETEQREIEPRHDVCLQRVRVEGVLRQQQRTRADRRRA